MVGKLVRKAYDGTASLGTLYSSAAVFVGLGFGALFFVVGAIMLATPPQDPVMAEERSTMGWTFLGLGIAALLLGLVGMFLSLRFKPLAAAVGVIGAGSVISSIVGRTLMSAVDGITSRA